MTPLAPCGVIDFADVKNSQGSGALAGGEFRADANSSSRGRGRRFYDGGPLSPRPADYRRIGVSRLLARWRDYSPMLGTGIKGGSPEHPQFVSTYRFNYDETIRLRLACGRGTRFSAYKNYLFVGDEVFSREL